MIAPLLTVFAFLVMAFAVLSWMNHKNKEIARLEEEVRSLSALCAEHKRKAEEIDAELEKTLIQVKILLSKIL